MNNFGNANTGQDDSAPKALNTEDAVAMVRNRKRAMLAVQHAVPLLASASAAAAMQMEKAFGTYQSAQSVLKHELGNVLLHLDSERPLTLQRKAKVMH